MIEITIRNETEIIYRGEFATLESLEEEGLRKAEHAIKKEKKMVAKEKEAELENEAPRCRSCEGVVKGDSDTKLCSACGGR